MDKIYMAESISACLQDMGIPNALTVDQIRGLADGLTGSCEMYSEYRGYHNIPNPLESEVERLKKQVEEEKKETSRVVDGFRKNVARRWNTDESNVSFPDIYHGDAEVRI